MLEGETKRGFIFVNMIITLVLSQFAVDKHSHKRMVGTREVLREDKETQPNGKVFTKLELGDYHWKTYLEIDKMAADFGRGLRELGLNRM